MAKLILVRARKSRNSSSGYDTLGRHPDNTIQILDRIISKEHAQIIGTPDGRSCFAIWGASTDLHRQQTRADTVLRDGDENHLGSTRLVFRDQAIDDRGVQRVTIRAGMMESHIRNASRGARYRVPPREGDLHEQAAARDYEPAHRQRAGARR